MPENIIKESEASMQKALAALERDFKRLRSGRATPNLVEHLRVDYYGSETPLGQVANISAPEPRVLVIKPYDQGVLVAIEKAIIKSDLGLNPQNDGKVIRLTIPPLTEETRKGLVHDTKKLLENGKIAVRNARRDANKHLDTSAKDQSLSEDILAKYKDRVQELTKKYESKLDALQKAKEEELLKI